MKGSIVLVGFLALLILLAFVVLYHGASDHMRLESEAELIWGNPAVTGAAPGQLLAGRWQAGEMRPQVRPVAVALRALEHEIHGYARSGYQADQIVLHAVVAWLLFLLLLRWLRSAVAAGIASLLFLAHPANTVSVLYLGGLSEILATGFFLGALLLMAGAKPPAGMGRIAGVGLLALGSMLSKETGFLLPFVAASVLLVSPSRWKEEKRLFYAVLGAAAIALLYRGVALVALPEPIRRIPTVDPTSALPLFPLLAQSIAGIAAEISIAVVPIRLSHDHTWLLTLHGPAFWGLAALALALVALAIWIAGRRGGAMPRTPLALLAILPLLAPALIPRLVGSVASERNLYLALPGFMGLAVLAAQRATERRTELRPVLAGVAIAIVALFGFRTFVRAPQFLDTPTLLQADRRAYPKNPQVFFELGNEKLSRSDYRGAIDLYQQALRLRADFPLAQVNLAAAYIGLEEYGLALRILDPVAIRSKHVPALRMVDAKAHYHAGLVLMRQERNKEAAEAFERTLLFYPDHLGARGNLGLMYVAAPQYVERGIEELEYVIPRETDPARRMGLEKNLNKAKARLETYVEQNGAKPSELEPTSSGVLGEPWKEAQEEGM